MKRYVIDASVSVKWYIPEPLSQNAVKYLELLQKEHVELLAPELIIAEMGNVVWKKLQRGELSLEEARLIVDTITDSFPVKLSESRGLLPAGLEVAATCGLTVYDSLYVALAAVKGATLVTADKKLAQAAAGALYTGQLELLG
ncbi:MAG: type II toxin-antitoxin system VapC family toxin [Clostridia bacterium]|nr:type II toxin-antitoxin system VapC family toxin [Clostridia bacterium]